VSSIGDPDENKFYDIGVGFVFSFMTHYQSVCVGKITEADPNKVWDQVEVLKKYTGSYLFGITNTLVQQHINILKSKSPTCAVKEWSNTMQLEKNALLLNKKESDGIIRILLVIALNFKYRILKEELGVGSNIINKASKHAWLYRLGTLILQKPKRTAQRLTDVQEKQFLLFFQDKENVSMSSYHIDSKTRLLILYLHDQKKGLWEKFNETNSNGIKRTTFIACLSEKTNLKYCKDL
ncbi:31850_t:CDS:2, partial [Racocetra persica]